MVYSFVCSVGVLYDYLPALASKYGTPGYSRFYIFIRDNMVNHVYHGLTRVVRLLEDQGFSDSEVYRVGLKDLIQAYSSIASIVSGIKNDIVLALSSRDPALDTIVLLSVTRFRKKYMLYITDGVETYLVRENIVGIINGSYRSRGGEIRILDALISNGGRCSRKELTELTGLSEETLMKYIRRLRLHGLVAVRRSGWIAITDLGKLHLFLNK